MKTIEERLPQWAVVIPFPIQDTQRSNEVLWQVQRYYEKYGVDVPETLQSFLNILPHRPACKINLPE